MKRGHLMKEEISVYFRIRFGGWRYGTGYGDITDSGVPLRHCGSWSRSSWEYRQFGMISSGVV
jgi:hypothetical protein